MSRDRWNFLFYGIYLGVDTVEAMMTKVPAKKTKVNVYGRHSGELEGQEDFIEAEEHDTLTVDDVCYDYYRDGDWDDVKKGLSAMAGGLVCDTQEIDGSIVGFVIGGHIKENATSEDVIRVMEDIDAKKKLLAKAFKGAVDKGWAVVTAPTLMSINCVSSCYGVVINKSQKAVRH